MLSVVFFSMRGGVETYTLQLVNALAPFGRVAYAIDSETKEQFGDSIDSSVTLLEYRRPRLREISGFSEMRSLARRIKQFAPNIFHLQGDGLWESFLLRNLCDTMPVVNTVHDPVKHIDQRTFLNNWTMKDAISRSAGWVVHSPALKRIFLEKNRVNEEQVLVHPHGVYDYYLKYAEPSKEREKYILFFGALRFNKGADLLLEAFSAIQDRIPGWRIIFAGRAPLEKKIYPFFLSNSRSAAKQKLISKLLFSYSQVSDRIEFRNRFISDREAGSLFSKAGVVVLPYRHGSQSGVLALAAAFGCPVLATKVGNIPELLIDGRHAQLVEPDNVMALSEALVTILANKDQRESLGENLNRLAVNEWAWSKIAEKTIEFYKEILQKRLA
jgi:glycosyltransferase involved in cell wall biosynthesis